MWNTVFNMGTAKRSVARELPPAPTGPTTPEVVRTIFDAAAGQDIQDKEIIEKTHIQRGRFYRIKWHSERHPPRLDEFLVLCAAVNRSPKQIAAAAEEANPPPD